MAPTWTEHDATCGGTGALCRPPFPPPKLDLHGCQEIRGALKDIKSHRNTRVLDLGMCHNIKGSLHEISPHHHLTTLDLEQCDVDGDLATLSSLSNMERLRLAKCYKIDGDLGESCFGWLGTAIW